MIAESRVSLQTTSYVSFEIILAALPFLGFTKQNNETTINRDDRTPHYIHKGPWQLERNSFWFPCGDLKSQCEQQGQRSLGALQLSMPPFQLPSSGNKWAEIRPKFEPITYIELHCRYTLIHSSNDLLCDPADGDEGQKQREKRNAYSTGST